VQPKAWVWPSAVDGAPPLRVEPRPSATVWLYGVYTLSSYAWGLSGRLPVFRSRHIDEGRAAGATTVAPAQAQPLLRRGPVSDSPIVTSRRHGFPRSWASLGFDNGVNANTTDGKPVLQHCYCPLRIHTRYMTPLEARSMRELAALRMVCGRRRLGWRWRQVGGELWRCRPSCA
jgi:hypothetical protein